MMLPRMPGVPLKNPRWEKFCQLYVKGETAGSAAASYRAAGFNAGTWLHTNASKFLAKPVVRERIAELQRDTLHIEEAAMKTAIDKLALRKEAVLSEIAKIGFAKLTDYVRQTPDGQLVIDLEGINRDQAAGLVELQMTERGEGENRTRHVRIKLGNKLAALATLGKHLGLFVERQGDSNDDLKRLTADELRRHMVELDRKLQGFGGDGAAPGEGEGGTRALPSPRTEET
jgi:phage terminase small subunit